MRSRALSILIALLVLFISVSVAQAQTTAPPSAGIVTTNSNLRGGPGTAFAVVGSAPQGTSVEIAACNVDCTWYQLDSGEWIAAFLVDASAAPISTATSIPPTDTPTPEPAVAVSGTLNVHYLDVGQGDSTLLLGPDFTILIDAGRHNGSEVVPYLEQFGVQSIDLLIGTHPHADHIGQMDKVLRRFPVGEVWMSGGQTTSQTFERVLDAIAASGADYHEPRAGEVYAVGSAHIEVVHPANLSGDLNNDSVGVRIRYGQVAFLFTGDAERQGEAEMLARGHDLRAQVLQVGHHGSSTSSTQAFLNAVQPEVAIWSAGTGNSYGHPHGEIIGRLAQMDIATYGTAEYGTIVVTTDGQGYEVRVNGTRAPPVSQQPQEETGPQGTEQQGTGQPVTVNSNANLRAGPGTTFAVVGSAAAGTPVTPLGRNGAGDWLHVQGPDGQAAWIALFLVDGIEDAAALPVVESSSLQPPTEERSQPPTPEPPPTSTPEPPPSPTGTGGCAPGQVNINTASFEELQRIHQIGPDRANQILQLRPFRSVDDMVRIKGIAAVRLAEIKAQGVACVE